MESGYKMNVWRSVCFLADMSPAEKKHLELEKKCLTVDIFLHGPYDVDEKSFCFFSRNTHLATFVKS